MLNEEGKKVVDLQDFVPQRSTIPKQAAKHPSPCEGLGGLARWATADSLAYTTVEDNAIENRKKMTVAEQALWEQLRSNKLGVHFRRQHVIGMYIADFVSLKNHLIIEVDGEYHSTPEQLLLDAEALWLCSTAVSYWTITSLMACWKEASFPASVMWSTELPLFTSNDVQFGMRQAVNPPPEQSS